MRHRAPAGPGLDAADHRAGVIDEAEYKRVCQRRLRFRAPIERQRDVIARAPCRLLRQFVSDQAQVAPADIDARRRSRQPLHRRRMIVVGHNVNDWRGQAENKHRRDDQQLGNAQRVNAQRQQQARRCDIGEEQPAGARPGIQAPGNERCRPQRQQQDEKADSG